MSMSSSSPGASRSLRWTCGFGCRSPRLERSARRSTRLSVALEVPMYVVLATPLLNSNHNFSHLKNYASGKSRGVVLTIAFEDLLSGSSLRLHNSIGCC